MFGKYKPLWGKKKRLKSSYDAVIIGGGLHGLATAYFLAKEHGLSDVAILEKRYMCGPTSALSTMYRFTRKRWIYGRCSPESSIST